MKESVICSVIDVDCYQNSEKNIELGGPKYIGFEFLVRRSEKRMMTEFVRCMLHEYNIPVISIKNSKSIIATESEVITMEQIRESIEQNNNPIVEKGKVYYRKSSQQLKS